MGNSGRPCLLLTDVVKYGESPPWEPRNERGQAEKPRLKALDRCVLQSVSLDEQRQTLEEIARQKKVSLAWVVREAVDNYVSDRQPLFSNLKGNV